MRRIALFLTVAASWPLLICGVATAGGGFLPAFPPEVGLPNFDTSGNISALIILDPNGPLSAPPATSTGGLGAIAVTGNGKSSTAVFRVEPGSSLGELRFGCNLDLTNGRFVDFASGPPPVVGLPLGGPTIFANWLPTSVTLKVFSELGINLVSPLDPNTVLLVPGVAGATSQQCVPFPKENKTLDFQLFRDLVLGFHAQKIVDPLHLKAAQAYYPDRTIVPAPSDSPQWFPGILVLQVQIGLWGPTP